MKRRQYPFLIMLIVAIGFSGAVAQESGAETDETQVMPRGEGSNGTMSVVLKLVLGAVLTLLGFFAGTVWDYCKLKIMRRAEVQKLSLEKLFDFARKYYFGIVFYAMGLARNIDSIQRGDADGTDRRDDLLEAFYNLTQYRREIAKFTAVDSATWFLARHTSEWEVNDLYSDLEKLLPFSRSEDSYLAYVASREDASGANGNQFRFISFSRI